MDAIMRYLRPLWIFLGSQVAVLLVFLFFPTLAEKCAALLVSVPGENIWGWTWVVGGARIIIVVALELAILYKVGRAFLDEHSQS